MLNNTVSVHEQKTRTHATLFRLGQHTNRCLSTATGMPTLRDTPSGYLHLGNMYLCFPLMELIWLCFSKAAQSVPKTQQARHTAIVHAAHAVTCLERCNYLKYRQAAFISVSLSQLLWGQKGNQCIC